MFVPPALWTIGVVLSIGAIAWHAFIRRNPSRISFRRLWRRWLGGLALFAGAWSLIGVFVCLVIIEPHSDYIPPWMRVHYRLSSLLLGLMAPHATRLADLGIRRWARGRWFTDIAMNFLIGLSDITYRYFRKIINREERKIVLLALNGKYNAAIGRLFEFHMERIARDLARGHDPDDVRRVLSVRHPAIKLRMVMRHRGSERVVRELSLITADPRRILPTWPACADRRAGQRRAVESHVAGAHFARDRRSVPGRRKSDSPYVWEYIVEG